MSDNAIEVQQVRKKTIARNRKRKQRLAASAQDRSTELSQQRKRMRLLRDRETPARRSARLEAFILCIVPYIIPFRVLVTSSYRLYIYMHYRARRSTQCVFLVMFYSRLLTRALTW